MMAEELNIESTSRVTAEAPDIILRETKTTRLVFRPILVSNQRDPDASVKGHFLFQRRKVAEKWKDFETIPLSSLKAGEGYKLEIKSAELRRLHQEVADLYQLHEQSGVPRGKQKFIKATPQLEALAGMSSDDVNGFLSANLAVGADLLTKLLHWAIESEGTTPLIERLIQLGPTPIKQLNAAAGLQTLKLAVHNWKQNARSDSEEYWQKTLSENSFVLEHVFSWPASIVSGKAYVGGKTVINRGGNIVDFLIKNDLTQSAALVEIKTPVTPIIGPEYRNGVFNVSTNLTGSVMQVLNYKQSLQEQYLSLTRGQPDLFQSFDPQCVVILGTTRSLDTAEKQRSFELYRRQMTGVTIVTYDELYERTQKIIALIESPEATDSDDENIPF